MWGEQDPPALPKAADHPDTKNMLTVYTQNAHGLRANEEKVEYISRLMDSKSIDAHMIQETHLPGDLITYPLKSQLMIHHGPELQSSQGMKGGIAIIAIPKMEKHWKREGSVPSWYMHTLG